MTTEAGHFPNFAYTDQNGNEHLNGANLYDSNENPIAQKIAFTIAKGGSANICTVNMVVCDGKGSAIAAVFELEWWMSDSSVGNGLTATSASGTVGAGTPGTDVYGKVSKKAGDALTDNTGTYQLSITDSGKTGFYIAVGCPGTGVTWISRQLTSADYD